MAKVDTIRKMCGQCYAEVISHKKCPTCGHLMSSEEVTNFLCVPQDEDTTHIKTCNDANCPKLK